MKWLRLALVELWAILALAVVTAFLGPFGTYNNSDFVNRIERWWALMMGAYIIVRPAIVLWDRVARETGLNRAACTTWGTAITAAPLAFGWSYVGAEEFRSLDGFSGLLPFALLSSFGILAIVQWAASGGGGGYSNRGKEEGAPTADASRPAETTDGKSNPDAGGCRLQSRLSLRFTGPIWALESEDHYVRVHGQAYSELVLIRLRDAIAEMDAQPGAQTHRSWWVAAQAVASAERRGRSYELILKNGLRVPIARDSVDHLAAAGMLKQ